MRRVLLLILLTATCAAAQCTPGFIMDSSAGTNGAVVTPTTLQNSTLGMSGSPASPGNDWSWVYTNPGSANAFTFSTAAHMSLPWLTPCFSNNGNSQYVDNSTLGIAIDTTKNHGVGTYLALYPNGAGVTGTTMVATANICTNIPQNTANGDTNYDTFTIFADGGGWPAWSGGTTYAKGDSVTGSDSQPYVSLQNGNTNHNPAGGANPTWWVSPTNFANAAIFSTGSNLEIYLEGSGGTGSPVAIPVDAPDGVSACYQIAIQWAPGLNTMMIFDMYGRQVGSTSTTVNNSNGILNFILLGNSNGAVTSGYHIYADKIRACTTGPADAGACTVSYPYEIEQSPWVGIIDPTRAIPWDLSGMPAYNGLSTLPDASWTQCGSTLAPGTYTGAAITSLISGCGVDTYFQFAAGNFTISDVVHYPTGNGGFFAIRGMGGNSTFVTSTSGNTCDLIFATFCAYSSDHTYTTQPPAGPPNTCNWIDGYAQGATQITLTNLAGTCLAGIVPNQTIIFLDQDDTGYTGSSPSGCSIDNGQLFIAADSYQVTGCNNPNGVSADGGGSGRTHRNQLEQHIATAVNGNQVSITPPLMMTNWNSGQTPQAWIVQPIQMVGLENMAIDMGTSGAAYDCVEFGSAYQFWTSGVKCTNSKFSGINVFQSTNGMIRDNYIYQNSGTAPSNYGIRPLVSGNLVIQNNIIQQVLSPIMVDGTSAGIVFAYNFIDNAYNPSDLGFMSGAATEHATNNMDLWEANVMNQLECGDDIHGTADDCTIFRNMFAGWESTPATPETGGTVAIEHVAFSRYENDIGNVLGTPGYHTNYSAANNGTTYIYWMGGGFSSSVRTPAIPTDSLTGSTTMRWGNYDVVTAAANGGEGRRWCGNLNDTGWNTICGSASEIPTGISPYANPVPSLGDVSAGQAAMPPSFYLYGKPAWFGAVPWPAIGPDVSSGNIGQCTGSLNVVGQFNGLASLSNSQCGSHGFSASQWGGHVNAIPAMATALNTMGMPLDGTGGVLPFGPGGNPPSPAPAPAFMAGRIEPRGEVRLP